MIKSRSLRPSEILVAYDALRMLIDAGFPLEYTYEPRDMTITIRSTGEQPGSDHIRLAAENVALKAKVKYLEAENRELRELSLF